MEENMMNTNEEVNEVVEAEEESGLGAGALLAIGGLISLAAVAGGKKVYGLWKDHKAKKENMKSKQPKDDSEAIDGDFKEVDSEE